MSKEADARKNAMRAALVELAQELADPDRTVPNLLDRIHTAIRRAVPDAEESEIWEAVSTYKADNTHTAERGHVPSDNPITLSADERLVLFELLNRLLDDEKTAGLLRLIKHDAEIWVLNSMLGQLERTVAASFSPDYRALVEVARSNLLAIHGGSWPRPLPTRLTRIFGRWFGPHC